ncbi:hypothetical protein GIB67_039943 [Kingdonia uniflora]|uniref:Uncharacterized protein n=1 Tax=Kingdonia uniflora TaxID=39325 RepID=A0A7J7P405_9MAGN|nr:hypothetical protein GIB67_039943 [Kingdonia uniflora]
MDGTAFLKMDGTAVQKMDDMTDAYSHNNNSHEVALANSGYPKNGQKRNGKAVLSSAYLSSENG